MIYLGVNILENSFKIVALSEHFQFIGKAVFDFDEVHNIKPWVGQLKTDSHELTKWYFDQLEFMENKFPVDSHQQFDKLHKIYLVNHRKLIEIINFFSMYTLYQFQGTVIPETTFFLAAAEKIIQNEYICCYQNDFMKTIISLPF